MRLRNRNLQQRVRRMTLRAHAQAPAAALHSTAARMPRRQAQSGHRQPVNRPENCRRESPRAPVEAEVAVKKLGGFGFQLQALNVSAGGCRVELIEMVNSGEPVIVRLPTLEPLGAEVAWVQGANAGLHFNRPLHPAVFDQLMDRFTACAA
ncbi:MAG: PilZ domain-containing protein [Sphingomicrobium sp.]